MRTETVRAAGKRWTVKLHEEIAVSSLAKLWSKGARWDYACTGVTDRESRESRRWGLPVHEARCRSRSGYEEGFEIAEDFDGEGASRMVAVTYLQWAAVPGWPDLTLLPEEVRRGIEPLAAAVGPGYSAYQDLVDSLSPTKAAAADEGGAEVGGEAVPILR